MDQVDEHVERHPVPPKGLLAMVWITTFVLSLYGAGTVRDFVDESELLSSQVWLRDGLTQVMKASDAIGLDALRSGLGGVRARVNEPYTFWERPPEVAPPPEKLDPPDAGRLDAGQDALPHYAPPAPKRVLVVGASSIQFALGGMLEKRLREYEEVEVKRFGKLATGLSRPDFFDWPKKLRALVSSFRPDLVIANFGGNGAQAIPLGRYEKVEFGTDAWDEVYAKRVREMTEIAQGAGAEVVWLGMPVMQKDRFSKKMRRINRVQAAVAEETGATFVSTWQMAAKPDGTYRETVRHEGRRGLMRTSDGVHYSRLGASFVVEQILRVLERRFRLAPKDPALAVAERHAFASRAADGTVAYVAYLPRGEAPRPGLLLLPAPESAWDGRRHPHRGLQALAEHHQRALLVLDAEADLDPAALEEVVEDAARHLPMSRVVGLAGAGARGGLALRAAFAAPTRFEHVSAYRLPAELDLEVPAGASLRVRLAPALPLADRIRAAGLPVTVVAAEGRFAAALDAIVAWHASPPAP